jgi:hypothetical protein
VSLKRKSKKRVAIPFKKQRSKEKKNKGAKKKKEQRKSDINSADKRD